MTKTDNEIKHELFFRYEQKKRKAEKKRRLILGIGMSMTVCVALAIGVGIYFRNISKFKENQSEWNSGFSSAGLQALQSLYNTGHNFDSKNDIYEWNASDSELSQDSQDAPYQTTPILSERVQNLMAEANPSSDIENISDYDIDAFSRPYMDFSMKLFQSSIDGEINSLISPLSVMLALSMTGNGAYGQTKSELESILTGGMDIQDWNLQVLNYLNHLPAGNNLKIADSIWFRDYDFQINPDFLQVNASYYQAGLYRTPFDTQTISDINDWADQKTDHMIPHLLEELDPQAVMILISALSFEAKWESPYYDYNIGDGTFYNYNGKPASVSMMNSVEDLYLEDNSATGFIKEYYNGKYRFVALLPKEGIDINDYIASLDASAVYNLLADAKTADVYAALPQFEYDYSIDLANALSSMGLTSALDSQSADFSAISPTATSNRLHISQILHKTFIKVDAEGTRAGAATATEMPGTSLPEQAKESYTVTLDRPFVYLIIDRTANLPVFIGTVMNLEE